MNELNQKYETKGEGRDKTDDASFFFNNSVLSKKLETNQKVKLQSGISGYELLDGGCDGQTR